MYKCRSKAKRLREETRKYKRKEATEIQKKKVQRTREKKTFRPRENLTELNNVLSILELPSCSCNRLFPNLCPCFDSQTPWFLFFLCFQSCKVCTTLSLIAEQEHLVVLFVRIMGVNIFAKLLEYTKYNVGFFEGK